MARMLVVYRTPSDPEAFDRHYFEIHVPLAKKLPGLRRYDVSRGPIVTPNGQDAAYLIATLSFDGDIAAIHHAFASEAGQECAADRRRFAPDPSQFQMFLFDDQDL
jgi:uncharacterized protein (TIGR02118 family)